MEYLLDQSEYKKFIINVNQNSVGEILFETLHRKLFISAAVCGKLLTLSPIIIEKFYKLKNNFLIFYKQPLQGDLYIVMEYPFECVQLRRFYHLNGLSIPTEDGITLKESQWITLVGVLQSLFRQYPILQALSPCGLLHPNQEDTSNCSSCCWDFEDKDDLDIKEDVSTTDASITHSEEKVEVIPDSTN